MYNTISRAGQNNWGIYPCPLWEVSAMQKAAGVGLVVQVDKGSGEFTLRPFHYPYLRNRLCTSN